MVQRKVPNKLGIQADHDKFEKRFSNLKTSSQFQDGKHRGADLKKKMKKSRSIKLSDVESLRSSPLRKNSSQPGKPPPPALNVPNTAASPQKQPLAKTTYGSPNYMKPTSCSHARKEQSQVSLRSSPPIFSDSKNQNRKNLGSSKLSSASSKPERSLARTSSLKLVRTLIRSPSFKSARAPARKSSRVALCADVNVQRETCSSTLKDTKFPDYLMISPGGTEAEGTSVMKVCPYTYCSLNGHRHSPVPPLKSFLSARRRSLKTQKMMKLQALSPRGAKRYNDGVKEIDFQQMFDENDKTAEKEADLDFFVEIYATNNEDDTEAIGRKAGADSVGEQDGYEGPVFPNAASDETETVDSANNLVVENLSDRSLHSESESEAENFGEFPEDRKEDANEDYGSLSDQEENSTGSCSNESNSEDLSSTEMDYSSSETTDMEWEEGQFSTAVLDGYESGPNAGCSITIQDADMHEESLIKSDAMNGDYDNLVQDFYVVLQKDGDVSEQDGIKKNFEILESRHMHERMSYDQLSYSDDAFEEGSELSETDCVEISSSSMEEPNEELPTTGKELQEQNGVAEAEDHEIDSHLGDVESNCSIVETGKASDNQPENAFHEDETSTVTGDQISIPSQDMSETDDAEANEGCNGSPDKGNSETDQGVPSGDLGSEPKLPTVVSENQMEAVEQIGDVKPSPEIQVSDSVHDASEADEDEVKVDDYDNYKKTEPLQVNDIAEDGNLSNGKYKKPITSSSNESEDQSDLRLKKSGISNSNTGQPHNVEVKYNSEPEATKNFNTANNSISPGMKRKFSKAASNFEQELPNTYNHWKRIKCKRLSIDEEEQRKFNPREPNYLPLVPDPEAEKVDLRHQIIDEKKNADEWMLDFALQQAVTKLAPARKKKVALLVAAFEAVMPAPKVEKHLKHPSAAFSHARPMQACS
ncbi:calmodulin binding protein PICBP [Pyrus x bretschneideri]|uniref:calmodulin binding protein PICBP n=1 Tax=Pyrus x bretschneideri TaxID=225117 RepID=UPI002030B291|nr:calmodulin binding protein PICBP [Pyrus x bretschneideri]